MCPHIGKFNFELGAEKVEKRQKRVFRIIYKSWSFEEDTQCNKKNFFFKITKYLLLIRQ